LIHFFKRFSSCVVLGARMALTLLQGYSSHSDSSDTESEDDGIVVTIDRRVISGDKPSIKKPQHRTGDRPGPKCQPRPSDIHTHPPHGNKRPHPRTQDHPSSKRKPEMKWEKPCSPPVGPVAVPVTVVSTLDMPHYDLGQNLNEADSLVPLPREINDMFAEDEEDERARDDPALHEGRLRSFAHSKNSWASYVFIDLAELDLGEARNLLVEQLDMEPILNPHLSLSRVVSLRHHWLDPLMESLKQSLGMETRFHLSLDKLQVFVNDEGTRTFVGLTASAGWPQLTRISRRVDSCLAEYSLPHFYRPPTFHCSLAWCLGDRRAAIRACLQKLSLQLVDCLDDDVHLVRTVNCKAGNKQFKFNLI